MYVHIPNGFIFCHLLSSFGVFGGGRHILPSILAASFPGLYMTCFAPIVRGVLHIPPVLTLTFPDGCATTPTKSAYEESVLHRQRR